MQFDVVAPDGKKFRLNAPDNASPDQVKAAAERAKAALAQTPPNAPAEPAPQGPPTERIVEPPVYSPGGLGVGTPGEPGLAGTALYRGLVRPAAELSGLFNKYTGLGASPEEFRQAATGLGFPGAANLPGEAPEGVLGTLAAATSPAEVFMPVLWGIGTGAQFLTDNEAIGDAVEGAAGLFSLGRSLVRRRAAVRVPEVEGVPRPEFAGRSPAEVRYIEQGKRAKAASAVAEHTEAAQVRAEALSARLYARSQEATRTAARAEEAVQVRHTAARNRVEVLRARLQSAKDAREVPEQVIKQSIGLPPTAPAAREAGEMLTAAGVERVAAGGEGVGVASMRLRSSEATRNAYAAANAIADERGVMVPMASGTGTSILDAMLKWGQRVEKHASVVERDAVKALLDEMSTADALPYSRMNDLYARISSIALNPREYAVSAGPLARTEFTRLKETIAAGLRAVEVADPQLLDAANAARQAAREGAKVRQTAKALIGQTPEDAFASMVRNPTHLRRVMTGAGSAEQESYRQAFWMDLVQRNTDLNGMADTSKMLSEFERLPEGSRALLASGSTHEARVAMMKLAAGERETSAMRSAIRNAEKEVRTTMRELKDVQKVWTRAAERAGSTPQKYGDVIEARRLHAAAEKEAAAQLGDVKRAQAAAALEQKTLDELGGVTRAGKVPKDIARSLLYYHGMKAMQGVLGGNGLTFASGVHGGLAYLLGRRPRLVRDLVNLPVDSPSWRVIAEQFGAVTRGWRGFVEENPDVITPGQAAPQMTMR